QQQQQFIHGGHYIHHNPAIPAYYPVYPSQQQPHHQVYYVPARQPQAYNLPVQQANIGDSATTMSWSRPQNPPNPITLVQPNAADNPIRNAPTKNRNDSSCLQSCNFRKPSICTSSYSPALAAYHNTFTYFSNQNS
ncbi:hypothetical protein KIW84_020319, partial [Lathyrus oleraceus]